jgi:hypothetical protein
MQVLLIIKSKPAYCLTFGPSYSADIMYNKKYSLIPIKTKSIFLFNEFIDFKHLIATY